jgi:hypothetical protein
MKKILLALAMIPSLVFAQSEYQGESLHDFQKEDIELKIAMRESAHDLRICTSWFKSPSTVCLKRIKQNKEILKTKLPIIEHSLEKAVEKIDKIRSAYSWHSGSDAAAVAMFILAFPWVIASEIVKDREISAQKGVVRSIKDAKKRVERRIQNMEKVVARYNR